MSASFLKSRTTLYGALLFFVAQILDFIMQLSRASARTRAGKPLPENFTPLGISWEVFLIVFAGVLTFLLWRLYAGRSRLRRGRLYLTLNIMLCVWGGILAARSIGEMALFDLILLLDALTYVTALIIPCALLQICDHTRLVPEEWKLLVPAAVTVLFTGLSVFSSVLIIRASSKAGDYSIWIDMPHLLQRGAVLLFAVSAVLKVIRIRRTYPAEMAELSEKEEQYWDRVTTAYAGDAVPAGAEAAGNAGAAEEPEEEEAEEEESVTECPGCGRRIPESLDRCPHCGTELVSAESIAGLLKKGSKTAGVFKAGEEEPEEEEEETPEGPLAECPGCGRMIPESAEKCPHCGAEFVSAVSIGEMLRKSSERTAARTAGKLPEREEEPEEEEAEAEEIPEGPVTECPGCGRMIPESAEKCPHCGAEFVSAGSMRDMLKKRAARTTGELPPAPASKPEPKPELKPEPKAEAKREPERNRTEAPAGKERTVPCPRCGKQVPERLETCPRCGAPMKGDWYYAPDEEIRLFD